MALNAVFSNLLQGVVTEFHTDHNYPGLIADRLKRITHNLDPHEGQAEGYIPEGVIWRISLIYEIYYNSRQFITLCAPEKVKESIRQILDEKVIELRSRTPKYTTLSTTEGSHPDVKKALYGLFFNKLVDFPDQTTDHPELAKLLKQKVLRNLEYYPPPGKPLLLPSTRYMGFLLKDMSLYPGKYAHQQDIPVFTETLLSRVRIAEWRFSGIRQPDGQLFN